MGNDGGSIPKRRELVKNAARTPTISELKATALELLGHAWTHCALSGETLDFDNLVSDWRGRLYNYEAVLRGLMPADDESAEPTAASQGIRSLRDVVALKTTKHDGAVVCPISMKALGPSTKSVYIVPCGHVFAEAAMKEIQEKACPQCSEPFESENVVPIGAATTKELDKVRDRIEALRAQGLTHSLKKEKSDKKDKKKKRKGDDVRKEEEESKANGESGKGPSKAPKKAGDPRTSGINNALAATLTERVMAEQQEKNKRRKMVEAVKRG